MKAAPFDRILGHELDTVSFVRDYVEFRIDYSIFRALTGPTGSIDGVSWRLGEVGAADLMCRYIGLTVLAVEHAENEHITVFFDGGATISVSLLVADRAGPESAHFVPAGPRGEPDVAGMWVW